ncbi:MAG: hypothetical protein LM517_02710, partial [Nitrosomonas sp.]|nr:hypothetical protein [Nitrosomonas sp.]
FKNIIICHCGVLLILIVDLGRSLSTDYTALFSFHTPEMIIARNLPKISSDEIFRRFKHKFGSRTENTVQQCNGRTLELRKIEETDYGFRGAIGSYRESLLPHVGIPGGNERELNLEENEHLIEKAYFKYFSDYSLLIFQRNRMALNSSLFSLYLSSFNGYTTALNPILEVADLKRLMGGEANLRSINLTIARPTNPDLFLDVKHDFNNAIIASLNSSNAASVNLTVRGDGRSRNPKERYLDSALKRALLELLNRFNVKKADIQLEENGIAHPLDLIADRLTHSMEIEMQGKYPDESQVWYALKDSRRVKERELQNYFVSFENGRLL